MTKLFAIWLAWRALRVLVAIALVVALLTMLAHGQASRGRGGGPLNELRHQAKPLERQVQHAIQKVLRL